MKINEFYSRVDIPVDWDECYMWRGSVVKGYGQLSLSDRPGKSLRAHRIAWEKEYGPIPADRIVCHHCDTPLCVNVRHLFLGTWADNTHDMMRKNRQPIGERHWMRKNPERIRRGWKMPTAAIRRGSDSGNAKLTEQDVVHIRAWYAAGHSQISIAAAYGMKQPQISAICIRNAWKHVA